MKMMKNLYIWVCILLMMNLLTGCAKGISTEKSTVQVKIVDAYCSPMTIVPVGTGNSIIKPAAYRITVKYKDVDYDIFDADAYHKYSDKIGKYVNGTLQTKIYDDGTKKYNITGLE